MDTHINSYTHCVNFDSVFLGLDTNSMMYPLDKKMNQQNRLISLFEIYHLFFWNA